MFNSDRIVIVDLDGTVYDSSDRSHHIEAKDWDAFHEASQHSPPHTDVIEMLQCIDRGSAGRLTFIAITGRNERYREITLDWLVKHNVPIDSLWMRPDNNYEKDVNVKALLLGEALAHHNMTQDQVWFAVEDRDQVVDFWRSIGINCYQVREGTF